MPSYPSAGTMGSMGPETITNTLAEDLASEPLPAGCDLILLAGVCQLLRPDVLAELFGRIEEVAAPRATLVVVDLFVEESAPGSTTAPYALGLVPRGGAGGLHSFATCARLMHQAGFRSIERVDLDGHRSAVRARKLNGEGAQVEHGAASASLDAIPSCGRARR